MQLLTGDAITILSTLPDASVHCCVTSPPYWGLRDYGTATWEGGDAECDHKMIVDGGPKQRTNSGGSGHVHRDCKCGARRVDDQLGLERTPQEYVARMVEVFREVRRVLRDDGTLWLNLGDSYSGSGEGGGGNRKGNEHGQHDSMIGKRGSSGLKPKDLVGIPWRVAFALQDDGWWLRAEIIWAKRAPMPESVTDRPTRSHEQIFLLSKAVRYFYDAEAVKETGAGSHSHGNATPIPSLNDNGRTHNDTERTWGNSINGRNQRDVWLLSPEPYPEAHFATFPTEIPRRAILAGTSERGCCPACGAPWKRMIVHTDHPDASAKGSRFDIGKTADRDGGDRTQAGERMTKQTIGWLPGCTCAREPVPCTVLDPFMGSGTTGFVALELGRDFIGIELNPAYVELARKRIAGARIPLRLA